MKILWFSNCSLNISENKLSGSWLYSMASLLTNNHVQLINICVGNNGQTQIKKYDINESLVEYQLPKWHLKNEGFPSTCNRTSIKALCLELHPDIIHVWGVENYFSSLIPTFNLNIPLLLEIQGLHKPCSDVYYGDMSFKEVLLTMRLREWLFPFHKSIFAFKYHMWREGKSDSKKIKLYKYISYQSKWVKNHLLAMGSTASLYKTDMSLRNVFFDSRKWSIPKSGERNFYCSAAGPVSYKSIQTAIKAFSIVHSKYPNSKLYIIGDFIKKNWLHQIGYLSYIYDIIDKENLSDSVVFTGPLEAADIIRIMYNCVAMIQTSFVESYSLALVEAQSVGIPSVVSYAGAMPELAIDNETALFYQPGDYVTCASLMVDLIENEELSSKISNNSYNLARDRNNNSRVILTQINIYKKILENEELLSSALS